MKQRELNFQEMLANTLGHFDLHPDDWNGEAPVVARVNRLKTLYAALQKFGGTQRRGSGSAAVKDAELDRAVSIAFPLATRLRSFARSISDPLLLAAADHNESDLRYGQQELRIGYMNDILDKAVLHARQLEAFKVRPDDIEALRNALQSAGALRRDSNDARSHIQVATSGIPATIDDCRAELEALDDDVPALLENDEFIQAYFVARRVTDRRATRPAETPAG
ncbi:MAG: hypothetical protein EOO11_21225 [Chitinophagaceae bacterium]|nr:MAG: hypothetical protein EOO11_21225 [Chitinophagaceae bacterium]